MSSVVPFPQLSEIDRQFEELEKQRRLIREQFAQVKNTHKKEQEHGKRKLRQLLGDAPRT